MVQMTFPGSLLRKITALLLFSAITVTQLHAQRNGLKIVGASFDNLIGPVPLPEPRLVGRGKFDAENKFSYNLVYERAIGTRLSVSLGYSYFFSGKSGYSFQVPYGFPGYANYYGSYNAEGYMILSNGTVVMQADFKDKGFGLTYETRIYAKPFTALARGAYMGFNLGYFPFTESLTNVTVYDLIQSRSRNSAVGIRSADVTNTYGITRYGVKFGAQAAYRGIVDFYVGVNLNSAPSRGKAFSNPTGLNSVSVTMGLAFGFGL